MAKKSSEKSGEGDPKKNEKLPLKTTKMKEWSSDLKALARKLDNYSNALERADIKEFEVIWAGFDSAVKRAKYLMRNQIQRQVKNSLENAGYDAMADELE